MKKRKFLALFIIFFIISCGSRDKQAQLERLEKQKDELTEKINKLKAEIAKQGSPTHLNERTAHVNIAQVNPELFKHYIEVQGKIESDNNILVPAQSTGIVKKIYVDKGNKISRGQLLAELDGAVIESSIAEIKNSLELATTIYERQQRLWNKNIGTEIEYLQAKNNKENLEKKLQTLNEQYKLTKINSPISGTVDEVFIKEGEAASASFGAIRIVQLTNLKITAALSENYILQVKKGDIVKVYIPVLQKKFNLKIDAVSQVIDPRNRTFSIEMKIPKDEKVFKPNMLAILTINDYTNPEALTIPQKIVQKTSGEQFIFVATKENDNWLAQKRNVELGKYYGDKVEIIGGLNRGEYVVIFGFQNLADGQRIAVEMNNHREGK